jgi:hypothetical protein
MEDAMSAPVAETGRDPDVLRAAGALMPNE